MLHLFAIPLYLAAPSILLLKSGPIVELLLVGMTLLMTTFMLGSCEAVAIELAKLGICNKIIGLDISKDFVEIAQRNAKKAGVGGVVEFQHGNVADIHFPDNSFDFIICTAAFKNFKQPFEALNQMCRVLKSGGNALIADMNRKASNQQIEDYLKSVEASSMDKLFMKLIFKYFLRTGAYTKDEFTGLISKTAIKQYDIREKGMGFFIYLTK